MLTECYVFRWDNDEMGDDGNMRDTGAVRSDFLFMRLGRYTPILFTGYLLWLRSCG